MENDYFNRMENGFSRANSADTTPAQFTQLIDGDRKRYAQIIRERKITVN